MAKSGQYIPQRSHPEHFSGATTCGGWYPFALKADESSNTFVGQNSTQKPQPLHRSTVITTPPLAIETPFRRWMGNRVAKPHALTQAALLGTTRIHISLRTIQLLSSA
jgi:hypothetical protein